MAIKPIDIRRKEFNNSFRGYDQNGVDDFLDTVADEFERIYTDNVRMRDEIQNVRERLQQFEDLEGSIRSALIHAEQAADDLRKSANREAETLRESAKREAELTVKEAQNRAHQMLADSSSRVERVQESYEALRHAKQTFAADFRHLLKSYLAVMDNADVATAKEIEASLRERLDTESVAAAREARAHEGETQHGAPFAETSVQDQETSERQRESDEEEGASMEAVGQEDDRTDDFDEVAAQDDPEATQAFTATEAREATGEPPADAQPETEEPEYEPSSATASTQGTAEQEAVSAQSSASESPAAEEVDREEPGLASQDSSNDFFGEREQAGDQRREDEPRAEDAPQREEDNRIFRASRFLRRRG
ncbi:MAG TPA: DivIVA domain-containing protein [Rubrobacteraceae bacterium]|nr:DivIVA domain-containing protein [Rubrobacteraceae bacterium]